MPTYSSDPVLSHLARAAAARREYLRQIGYLVPDTRTPARRRADEEAARKAANADAWMPPYDDAEDLPLTAAGNAAGESTLDVEWRLRHLGHRDPEGRPLHERDESRPEICAECWLIVNDPDHDPRRLAGPA